MAVATKIPSVEVMSVLHAIANSQSRYKAGDGSNTLEFMKEKFAKGCYYFNYNFDTSFGNMPDTRLEVVSNEQFIEFILTGKYTEVKPKLLFRDLKPGTVFTIGTDKKFVKLKCGPLWPDLKAYFQEDYHPCCMSDDEVVEIVTEVKNS